jgi:glycosyltransferase involved in cell wall biosynthesis
MRLLHVVDTLDPKKGGVSQAVKTMAEEVFKVGLSSEILTLDPEGHRHLPGILQITNLGKGQGPWHFNKQLIPWLLANVHRFDTIIVHGLWLYQTYAAHKALSIYKHQSKNIGKKGTCPALYVMPHGMLDPYFQKSSGRKLKAIRNWLYWKFIEKNVINDADGILFTCKEECLLAAKPFKPYEPKRELIIGLGVSEPPLKRNLFSELLFTKFPDLRSQRYLLFIGRIDRKKGLELLIRAYEKLVLELRNKKTLQQQVGHNDLSQEREDEQTISLPKLVIAGPGLNTSYGSMIADIAKKSSTLKNQVIFTGMLEGPEKWAAFYGCEAFVLPSHQENFGIAIVEALSCSKAVLISNKVNIWSEIKDSNAGIIAEDTIAGTYSALQQWMELGEEQKLNMGLCARRCYQKHFALDAATSRLLNAISYKS